MATQVSGWANMVSSSLHRGFDCAVGLVLQLLCPREVALDRVLSVIDGLADAWQGHSRRDYIERNERDRQRYQLGREGVLLERRERSLVAAVGFGVGRRALCVA